MCSNASADVAESSVISNSNSATRNRSKCKVTLTAAVPESAFFINQLSTFVIAHKAIPYVEISDLPYYILPNLLAYNMYGCITRTLLFGLENEKIKYSYMYITDK